MFWLVSISSNVKQEKRDNLAVFLELILMFR